MRGHSIHTTEEVKSLLCVCQIVEKVSGSRALTVLVLRSVRKTETSRRHLRRTRSSRRNIVCARGHYWKVSDKHNKLRRRTRMSLSYGPAVASSWDSGVKVGSPDLLNLTVRTGGSPLVGGMSRGVTERWRVDTDTRSRRRHGESGRTPRLGENSILQSLILLWWLLVFSALGSHFIRQKDVG